VDPIALSVSPGGARWAAVGLLEADPTAEPDAVPPAVAILDGREVGRYAGASRPDFSPDGAHVAWRARENDGRASLVVDGAITRSFEAPTMPPSGARFDKLTAVHYLADGRLVAVSPDGGGWTSSAMRNAWPSMPTPCFQGPS